MAQQPRADAVSGFLYDSRKGSATGGTAVADTLVVVGDTLAAIVIAGIAVAFLRWIYEHVVRFFTVGDWRRCPECDRVILRTATTCSRCGFEIRTPAHDPRLRPQRPAR